MAPPAASRADCCFPLCSAHPLLIPTKACTRSRLSWSCMVPAWPFIPASSVALSCVRCCVTRGLDSLPPHTLPWRKTQAAGGTPHCKINLCVFGCLFVCKLHFFSAAYAVTSRRFIAAILWWSQARPPLPQGDAPYPTLRTIVAWVGWDEV